jgi:Leucine-rich repeat (LRR) protein
MENFDIIGYILQFLDRKDFFKSEIYTICKFYNRIFNDTIIKNMYKDIMISNFPKFRSSNLSILTNLTSLDLRNHCGYIGLIKHIDILNNLKSLSLRDSNSITDFGMKYLTNLTFLDLSFNKNITNISFLNKLETLILTCNTKITYISNLTNLTSINLDRNNIITMESLKSLPKLSIIMLRHNHPIVKNRDRDRKWELRFVY